MEMRVFIAIGCLVCVGCELNITQPSAGAAPAPDGSAITITSTNNNTNNNDRSDTAAVPTPGPGGESGGEPGVALPLPAYGEGVTREIAATHPALLANSCQLTTGESAWQFLDLVIGTLRARDPRWGYLCKDASCQTIARDIVAYRASAGTSGIWLVDIIGNHCPGPSDPPPAVRWGVLPFETARPWTGAR